MAGEDGTGRDGAAVTVETRMVVEYGITLDGVWLPLALLRRLAGHGPWSAPFTEATVDQERVLVSHALAEKHNRDGLHRGSELPGFLAAVPFEPTTPLEKVPAPPAPPGPGPATP